MEFEEAVGLSILQGDVLKFGENNTHLVLRTNPDDPGTYKGVVVLAPSVPRWMSPYFADALQNHETGVAACDLNLYSHDWFEKIVYVPETDLPKDLGELDPFILPQKLVSHSLSTGCQTVSAQTRIQAAKLNGGSLEVCDNTSGPYYAVVSKFHKDNPTKMAEITIAALADVKSFVSKQPHIDRLADSYRLRNDSVVNGVIPAKRRDVFRAIKAASHAP